MVVNIKHKLSDALQDRCRKMLEAVRQKHPKFCYWRIVFDTGYYSNEAAKFRVELYGISAARPSWQMPDAKSIEEAIKLAEEKLGISSTHRHFLYSDNKIQGSVLGAEGIVKHLMNKFENNMPIGAKIIELNKWLSNAVIGDYCKIADATIAMVGENRVSI